MKFQLDYKDKKRRIERIYLSMLYGAGSSLNNSGPSWSFFKKKKEFMGWIGPRKFRPGLGLKPDPSLRYLPA